MIPTIQPQIEVYEGWQRPIGDGQARMAGFLNTQMKISCLKSNCLRGFTPQTPRPTFKKVGSKFFLWVFKVLIYNHNEPSTKNLAQLYKAAGSPEGEALWPPEAKMSAASWNI
ncbi:MAG: hypothetical protein IIC13_06130 [SAR324 cluster bacterium]|nr:hypothetical protein [SAR324 cluster bacterium]